MMHKHCGGGGHIFKDGGAGTCTQNVSRLGGHFGARGHIPSGLEECWPQHRSRTGLSMALAGSGREHCPVNQWMDLTTWISLEQPVLLPFGVLIWQHEGPASTNLLR